MSSCFCVHAALHGAVALVGVGVYGLVGSFRNFVNPVDAGWAEDIALLWALSIVAALSLITLGALTGLLAIRYPAAPWYVYGLLVRTPLGKDAHGNRRSRQFLAPDQRYRLVCAFAQASPKPRLGDQEMLRRAGIFPHPYCHPQDISGRRASVAWFNRLGGQA